MILLLSNAAINHFGSYIYRKRDSNRRQSVGTVCPRLNLTKVNVLEYLSSFQHTEVQAKCVSTIYFKCSITFLIFSNTMTNLSVLAAKMLIDFLTAARRPIFKLILVLYFLIELLPNDVINWTAEAFTSDESKQLMKGTVLRVLVFHV